MQIVIEYHLTDSGKEHVVIKIPNAGKGIDVTAIRKKIEQRLVEIDAKIQQLQSEADAEEKSDSPQENKLKELQLARENHVKLLGLSDQSLATLYYKKAKQQKAQHESSVNETDFLIMEILQNFPDAILIAHDDWHAIDCGSEHDHLFYAQKLEELFHKPELLADKKLRQYPNFTLRTSASALALDLSQFQVSVKQNDHTITATIKCVQNTADKQYSEEKLTYLSESLADNVFLKPFEDSPKLSINDDRKNTIIMRMDKSLLANKNIINNLTDKDVQAHYRDVIVDDEPMTEFTLNIGDPALERLATNLTKILSLYSIRFDALKKRESKEKATREAKKTEDYIDLKDLLSIRGGDASESPPPIEEPKPKAPTAKTSSRRWWPGKS